ncbi:MAG TPA: class I SAM-dependent methyltransferase [Acidobacteriota bacterium]|nr:class I SAM-dependent methyltransferase [Acidobacteriota bacterium]
MDVRSAKEKTKTTYDTHSQFFIDKFANPLSLRSTTELDHFVKRLRGKSVLDAGCGSGVFALEFQKRNLLVTAIDISEKFISYARSKGVDARYMDIEHITFPSESFDGVWAMSSLLHIPKKHIKAVLESFHRILRPHGVLHVTLKEGTGEKMVTDTTGDERFFSFWTIEEFTKIAQLYFKTVETAQEETGDKKFIRMTFVKL